MLIYLIYYFYMLILFKKHEFENYFYIKNFITKFKLILNVDIKY